VIPAPAEGGGRQRILVIRNRFIGDTLLAIPFLRNLRRNFPDAVIDVLVEPVSGDVLANCPYANELIRWSRPRTLRRSLGDSIRDLRETARWLAGRNYDRAYVLKRAAAGALLAWLAGIPHRVGFACQGQQLWLSRSARLKPREHEVEHFLEQLRCDGLSVDDGHNENWVDPQAAAKAEQLLAGLPAQGPLIFLAPRAGAVTKQWPAEWFGRVISLLTEQTGAHFVLSGGPGDLAMHREIVAASGPAAPQLHDCSAACTLADTAAVVARCDLCIGVDTGLVHLAASFGKPCVVIFGSEDPHQWHPWGTRYELLRSAHPQLSVGQRLAAAASRPPASQRWPAGCGNPLDVSVDDVVTASLRLLAQQA
jgi:heptosyltransferase-2